jgi:hypothetical protein
MKSEYDPSEGKGMNIRYHEKCPLRFVEKSRQEINRRKAEYERDFLTGQDAFAKAVAQYRQTLAELRSPRNNCPDVRLGRISDGDLLARTSRVPWINPAVRFPFEKTKKHPKTPKHQRFASKPFIIKHLH